MCHAEGMGYIVRTGVHLKMAVIWVVEDCTDL
jgi:hypothetical protein